MGIKNSNLVGAGTGTPVQAWLKRGESFFACGKRDGVLNRCSVERMDGDGTSFFSDRKYRPGEEVGLQLSVDLGRNEFATRILNGRIKVCRAVRSALGGKLCRAEVSWTPGGYAAGAAL